MIIRGNVVLKCPKTDKEVRLYRDCMKAGDPKNKCEHYKWFGIEGDKIVIACSYNEYEGYKKDMGKVETNSQPTSH